MTNSEIANLRLQNQEIVSKSYKQPGEVVKWLCAMQAQDYYGALWGIGLRTKSSTIKDVEKAIADKNIIRTWPMRGTLHFISPEDAKWMLKLLTPRIISKAAGRHKQLELNDKIFTKSYKIFEKALQGGKIINRVELMELLEQSGIRTTGQRGYHILWMAAQIGLICLGPMNEKQQTVVLLDEWIDSHENLTRDESITELTMRYFESHGPATINDFVWWSGLTVADARRGINDVKEKLIEEKINGQIYWLPYTKENITKNERAIYLLPGFDEYLLGYKDRSAILDPLDTKKIVPWSNGMFQSTIVINGKIAGIWKTEKKKRTAVIKAKPFLKLKRNEKKLLLEVRENYGNFLGTQIELLIED